jgi:hypothetical protein
MTKVGCIHTDLYLHAHVLILCFELKAHTSMMQHLPVVAAFSSTVHMTAVIIGPCFDSCTLYVQRSFNGFYTTAT